MQDHPDVQALRGEWANLFERVLACGAQTGAMAALDGLVQSAKARIGAPVQESNTFVSSPSRAGAPTFQKHEGQRAPSGSVRRVIRSTLEKSLPLRVHQIIEDAARTGRGQLKDTSVRMALQTMRKNGEAQQNDTGEWSLTHRSVVDLSPMQSDGQPAYREAA